MTIARQNSAEYLPINIHASKSMEIGSLWKLVRLGAVQINAFWWRTKAYGTILGVMLLTLVSLIFLSMHWSYRRLFSFLSHQVIENEARELLAGSRGEGSDGDSTPPCSRTT